MLPHYFFHTGSSERPYSVWNHLQKLGNLCQKWHSLQPLSLATCTEFLNSLCCFGGGQGSSVFFQQSPLSAGSRALPWRPSGKNRSSDSVDTRQTSTGSRVASFGHQGSALLPSRGRSLPRLPPYPFSLRCPGPGADLPGCHLHRPGRRPVSPEQALRRVQLGKRASRGLCRGRARAREPGPRPRRLRGGRPPHPHRCPASTAWRLESLSDGATCPPRRPPQPRCEAAEVWGRSRGAGAGPGLPGRRGWGEPAPRGGRGRRKGCVSSWARGGGAAGGGGGGWGGGGGLLLPRPAARPRSPHPPLRGAASRLAALRVGLLVPCPELAAARLAARPGELSRAQRRILRNNNRAGSAGPARPPRPPHHVRLCAVPGGQRLLRAARLLRAGLQPHVPARLRQPEGLHGLPQPRGGGGGGGRREPRRVGRPPAAPQGPDPGVGRWGRAGAGAGPRGGKVGWGGPGEAPNAAPSPLRGGREGEGRGRHRADTCSEPGRHMAGGGRAEAGGRRAGWVGLGWAGCGVGIPSHPFSPSPGAPWGLSRAATGPGRAEGWRRGGGRGGPTGRLLPGRQRRVPVWTVRRGGSSGGVSEITVSPPAVVSTHRYTARGEGGESETSKKKKKKSWGFRTHCIYSAWSHLYTFAVWQHVAKLREVLVCVRFVSLSDFTNWKARVEPDL